jgi:acylphosphatase
MTEIDIVQLHATVEGRVQGVSFRYFVVEVATELGITGWVRNRWNGNVEAIAEGPRPQLERLLVALNQGPRAARVTKVTHQWGEATGEFSSFRIRMTV